MKSIGAFQAKTHLSQLLRDVEQQDQIFAITKHGKTVALLTPSRERNPVAIAIASIRNHRRGVTLGAAFQLTEMIKEGRRESK